MQTMIEVANLSSKYLSNRLLTGLESMEVSVGGWADESQLAHTLKLAGTQLVFGGVGWPGSLLCHLPYSDASNRRGHSPYQGVPVRRSRSISLRL